MFNDLAEHAACPDRGEVLAVEGNDLIVRMPDGSIRHWENTPEERQGYS